MFICSELQHINFDKLLSHIQSAEKPKTVLSGIVSDIAKVALNTFVIKRIIKHPFILHRIILGFAEEYGVTLSGLRVGSNAFEHNKESEDCIMDVKVSIESIDYAKLADVISESVKSTGTKTNNHTVTETIRIIKPFIDETMSTIPPSAIVELFELLAREKVIELAQNSGITISDISLEAR
ncbi:MAG: hypothetical protein FWE83_08150 [Oscillospiraceae bacterium]|nr:hypothetical protein [Oscillospiraceae bacterium]